MTIEPKVYIDVYVAVTRACVEGDLPIPEAAQVLFMAAQPEAEVEVHDILAELKDKLRDWTVADLNALHACKIVSIQVPPDEDGCDHTHIAQVVELQTDRTWNPNHVHASRTNIDDVIVEIGKRFVPEDQTGHLVRSTGPFSGSRLQGKFIGNIEQELTKFREELDSLFPTAEEGG